MKRSLFIPRPVKNFKMSRTYKSKMPSYYCKVCYDNNKPEKEYRSHNVRNEQGKVCCPVLQSSICTYCGVKGHVRKYCTIIEKDKRNHDAIEKEKAKAQAYYY